MTADEFARRVEALKPVMYRVCRAQLSEPHDREDAVQEAILRAWEKQDGLREPKFFETWFIRILINACHDIQRRNRRTVAILALRRPVASSQLLQFLQLRHVVAVEDLLAQLGDADRSGLGLLGAEASLQDVPPADPLPYPQGPGMAEQAADMKTQHSHQG